MMVGVAPPNMLRRLVYRSGLVRVPDRFRPWLEGDLATRGIARRLAATRVLVALVVGLSGALVVGIPTGQVWLPLLVLIVVPLWGVVHVGFVPHLLLERRMRTLVERNDLYLP